MHVFAFHHITPHPSTDFDVSPHTLTTIIQTMVDSGYRLVPPSHALAAESDWSTLDIAVIFDDGYSSTMRYAEPLMARYGASFGMAPAPGLLIPSERPTHWHSSSSFVHPRDLRAWESRGGELLGHSYSHVRLTTLATSTIEYELDRELSFYEDNGVLRPTLFAYPFGDFDDRVKRVVSSRYVGAFATEDGSLQGAGGPYELHRTTFRQTRAEAIANLDWQLLEGPAA